VTNYFAKIGVAEVKMETHEMNLNDPLLITGPTTGALEFAVNEIRVDLEKVPVAKKGELCSIPVPVLVRRGDKVFKWMAVKDTF
jgi:putative protease